MRFNKSVMLSLLAAATSLEIAPVGPSQQKMVRVVVEMTEEQAFFAVLERGDAAGIDSLIGNGFDVNQKFENGATPLFMAIFSVSTIGLHAVDIVKVLIQNGARTDLTVTVDEQPLTPFALVGLLEEQIAEYAQTPNLPAEQHAIAAEIKQALMSIKGLVRI